MKLLKETEGQTIFTWNDDEIVLDTEKNPIHEMIENTCYDILGVERNLVYENDMHIRRMTEITEAVLNGKHVSSVPSTDRLTELAARREVYYQELVKLVYLLKNL